MASDDQRRIGLASAASNGRADESVSVEFTTGVAPVLEGSLPFTSGDTPTLKDRKISSIGISSASALIDA